MTDFYSTMVANKMLACSRREFDDLDSLLKVERLRLKSLDIEVCIQAEFIEGEGVFLFAKDYFCDDDLSEEICSIIGRFLSLVGQEYLEFVYSQTASRLLIGSEGGGSFRIYRDGRLVWPSILWPE